MPPNHGPDLTSAPTGRLRPAPARLDTRYNPGEPKNRPVATRAPVAGLPKGSWRESSTAIAGSGRPLVEGEAVEYEGEAVRISVNQSGGGAHRLGEKIAVGPDCLSAGDGLVEREVSAGPRTAGPDREPEGREGL